MATLVSCKYRPRRDIGEIRSKRENNNPNISNNKNDRNKKNIVLMESEEGVYYVPVEVNGIPMRFIFDTGASIISISSTEATFLYKQGKLTDDDILGTSSYQDANGTISEGKVIRLRTIKIGNKTIYDVEASIVPNQIAPLLLGQSALSRFGKISIDYNRSEIIFE
jgi:aspartyl protease family protein